MLRSKGSQACLFPPSFTPVSLSYPLFSPSRLQRYSFPIAAPSGANMPCHSSYCLCGTAQVPAGLCAARCPGQGPDTRLRSVCCCGLAHKTPLRVLPCCQRFPKRKQLSYQIRKAVFGYVSWRNAAGVLHMQSVILISITRSCCVQILSSLSQPQEEFRNSQLGRLCLVPFRRYSS